MIVPQTGYILIEPEKPQETTKGGIALPSVAHETPQVGKVVAVGNPPVEVMRLFVEQMKANISSNQNAASGGSGMMFNLVLPKEGDRVHFRKWGGDEIKDDDGKEFKVVKYEDILTIIK